MRLFQLNFRIFKDLEISAASLISSIDALTDAGEASAPSAWIGHDHEAEQLLACSSAASSRADWTVHDSHSGRLRETAPLPSSHRRRAVFGSISRTSDIINQFQNQATVSSGTPWQLQALSRSANPSLVSPPQKNHPKSRHPTDRPYSRGPSFHSP